MPRGRRDLRRKGFLSWGLGRAWGLRLEFDWMERRAGRSRWQSAGIEPWVLEPGMGGPGSGPDAFSGLMTHCTQMLTYCSNWTGPALGSVDIPAPLAQLAMPSLAPHPPA